MKRRTFLNSLILSSGSVFLVNSCKTDIRSEKITQEPQVLSGTDGEFIIEPERKIPVVEKVDVLVVGGGPSGVAAAISASRAGASTLLIERYNHLGGLWTGGLVLPLLSTHAENKNKKRVRTLFGVGDEIYRELKSLDMTLHEVNPIIDPEAAKYVMEVMMKNSGVKVFYHAWAANITMSDNTIKSVIIESKSGRVAILPKIVVDCTGDGDIFSMAGEDYDTMDYEIGLVHRLGNIDRINKNATGYQEMDIGGATPIPSVNWVNMTGGKHENALDFKKLSELQRDHRIEIWEKVQQIKKTPGYKEVFLLDTAPQQGVRMSRILNGKYKLTLEDSMTYKSFNDSIGISGAWINVMFNGRSVSSENRPVWQIPYRALQPEKTNNLMVAGRCFSFEKDLFQDARIIGTCLVTGHGAGAAAAQAIRSGNSIHDLDIKKIQDILIAQNAKLN